MGQCLGAPVGSASEGDGAAPFRGARLKIQRAREHFDALDQAVERYVAEHHERTRVSTTEPAGSLTVWMGFDEPPDAGLAVILGDYVHNLRGALDHLVYEVSLPIDGKKTLTQFPVSESRSRYLKPGRNSGPSMRDSNLAGVPERFRQIVDRLQPFHRAASDRARDPLAVLSWLDNVDKHRLLHPVATIAGSLTVVVTVPGVDMEPMAMTKEFPAPGIQVDREVMLCELSNMPELKLPWRADAFVRARVTFSERAYERVQLIALMEHVICIVSRFEEEHE